MSDDLESPSGARTNFFTSLPGILTGAAALITAVGTIVGIVVTTGGAGHGAAVSSTLPATSAASFLTSTGTGVTLAEWARRADTICRASEPSLERASRQEANAVTAQDEATAMTRLAILGRIRVSRLRALDMPPDSRADIENWLSLTDQQLNQIANAASVMATSNDPSSLGPNLEGSDQRGNEIDRLGAQLGAFRCVGG